MDLFGDSLTLKHISYSDVQEARIFLCTPIGTMTIVIENLLQHSPLCHKYAIS